MRPTSALRLAALAVMAIGLVAHPAAIRAESSVPVPAELLDLEVLGGSLWQVGDTYISGQPTEATLEALAGRGVKVVICLRTAREMADRKAVPFDERAKAQALGLEYVQVGLGPYGSYTPESLAVIRDVIDRHDGKVLMHCTVGGRASTVWAALRTKYDGLSLEDALAEGREMGLWVDSIEQLLGEKIEYRRTGAPSVPNPGWLVDANWLSESIDGRSLRLLDVRPDYSRYFEGHVRNATHLDAHTLRGPRDNIPAQFRSHERMAEIFAQANVGPGNRVIVYAEGNDILSSAMTVYALEKLGHLNASILDGGVKAAADANLLTQAFPAAPKKPAEFAVFENPACAATLADVEAALKSGGVRFVDARPLEQYEGTTKVWQRNGHIPGAVNVHWKRLTSDADAHSLRSAGELKALFESAGVRPDQPVIVYCGTGREASLLYLALTRELRYPDVRLYEGGWTEYSTRADLPVEN
ncbi:MAG: hypothetical protein IPP62_16610 [bacterium]|jgi:thiosulfate/3-mercaptopyruvate sulfurtransferase|nr:hypothetical protein [bacterium]